MLGRMLLTWRTIGRTFGAWIAPLFTGLVVIWLRLNVAVGMALDPLFFPSLRRTRLDRPIVIVGNPRTGTTFLHRFLDKQGVAVGCQLWEMLVPSLTLQFFVRPFLPLLEKVSPAKHHAAAAHKTSMTAAETDDAGMFFHFFDGFFLYGFFLAWAEEDLTSRFDPAVRDTSLRDFRYLEAVWRRVLVARRGTRIAGKLFSLGPRVNPFLERFPDARILFMLRDPISFVPSGMSLVTGTLDARFGFWRLPEETRRPYLERLYDGFLLLNRRFHDDWVAGRLPRDRVMLVHYDRLMADLEGLMGEMLAFMEVTPDEKLTEAIRKEAEKQRAYRSEHVYDLAKFGLDVERILTDYAFFYDTFGVRRPAPPEAPPPPAGS